MKNRFMFLTLFLSGLANGAKVSDVLTIGETRGTIPIFSIVTIHSPSDSINSVLVTACNFAATGFNDCFNADTNASLATTGTLAILAGQTIRMSVPAIASPLNFWQNFFPYNNPHTVVRITSSQGQDCDSSVVAYDCTTASACPGLSFAPPVTCNFN